MEKMDIKQLVKYSQEGLLKKGIHPTQNIYIWNYTEIVQYSKKWDPITLACRGLVTDSSGTIIARAFSKFFNLEEDPEKVVHDMKRYPSPRIFDKVDGSLGILFYYSGSWIFASRGSFTSEQAIKGFSMVPEELLKTLNKDLSHIFEIIYPENKIVVDYGSKEALIYLSSFYKDGTEDYQTREFMIKNDIEVVEEYTDLFGDSGNDPFSLKKIASPNKEGFVVLFGNGDRVKIKFEDYLLLHKQMSNLTVKNAFEWISSKKPIEEVLEIIPDEYHSWYKNLYDKINNEYNKIFNECNEIFNKKYTTSRKDFAMDVKNHPYRCILFKMYDHKTKYGINYGTIEKELNSGGAPKEQYEKMISSLIYSSIPIEKYEEPCSIHRKININPPSIVIILVGPSASGKSTWAHEYIKNHKDSIIVNRDSLRESFFPDEDYYNNSSLSKRENFITKIQSKIIEEAISKSLNIVVDNTNLKKEHIIDILESIPHDIIIHFKTFDCTVEQSLKNQKSRERKVPKEVIIKQFQKYEKIKNELENILENYRRKIGGVISVPFWNREESLPDKECIIFDIDGTLAIIEDTPTARSPYDMTRVDEDSINPSVCKILEIIHKGSPDITIILCSGRSEDAREKTEKWLKTNKIYFDKIYFRPEKNNEKDFIIKERMWREISKEYNIICLYDDRDQVVRHGRELGLQIYQVANGNF